MILVQTEKALKPQESSEQFREVRREPDFSGLRLNGFELPVVYVKSRFERKTEDPAFLHVLRQLEEQPQPGFFFTPAETGDKMIRVRLGINRHGVISSELFRDPSDNLYRDIDAKGVGFVVGYPIRVLPIQESSLPGDMELRGIYHYDPAQEDWLNTDELTKHGFRVARNVAMIELFELVDKTDSGEFAVVPRQQVGKRLWINMDSVRPVIHVRAMGTTARVWDLPSLRDYRNYMPYAKEIVDDAIGIVSMELDQSISPKDYAVWFIETLGKMLGKMHSNDIFPDFSKQIHGGTHNVTLDCRLLDLHMYDTPISMKRRIEARRKAVIERPELRDIYAEEKYTREEVEANNLEVEKDDIKTTFFLLNFFIRGLGKVYDLGNIGNELKMRFGRIYGKNYIPMKQRQR